MKIPPMNSLLRGLIILLLCSLSVSVSWSQTCTSTISSGTLPAVGDGDVICVDGAVNAASDFNITGDGHLVILDGGSLNLSAKIKVANTDASLTVKDGGEITGTGQMKFDCNSEANRATLTVESNGLIDLDGKFEIKEYTTIVNDGQITTSAGMHLDGTIQNCGTMTAGGKLDMHGVSFTCPSGTGKLQSCHYKWHDNGTTGTASASNQQINTCDKDNDVDYPCASLTLENLGNFDDQGGNVCPADNEDLTVAHDRYWVATANSNWDDTANWSDSNGGTPGESLPGDSTNVIFTNGSSIDATLTTPVQIRSIQFWASYGKTLELDGNSFTINGPVYNAFRGG